MRGYKVFNPDWTCRDFRYEVGKTYEIEDEPILCERGFHFCERLIDCFKFYNFTQDNKVAEVEALGEVIGDGCKSCTNKISILRELSWAEVLNAINMGRCCEGLGNTGDNNRGSYNSGIYNSGNCNSGHSNSGSYNSGDYNSGNHNSACSNSGDCNSGSYNSGHYNSGWHNSGDYNSGHHNSGSYNSGSYNSGCSNSGKFNRGGNNSGSYNSGYHNSGHHNSGNHNSGHYNSGYFNSGDFNATFYSSGCFNTTLGTIRMFNRPTIWTLDDWRASEAYAILMMMPSGSKWVAEVMMTDEEKAKHPEAETTDGYLKEADNAMRQEWWDGLSDSDKATIKSIPNFDAEIFKQITGICV